MITTKDVKVSIGMAGVYLGSLGLGVWHLWVSWAIGQAHGVMWALIAVSTPPFSDLVWLGASIGAHGVLNSYMLALVAALAATGLGVLLIESE